MQVESYLPIGREQAITRKELLGKTGLPDRALRQEIENARQQRGILICCEQNGTGYYIGETNEELMLQYRQMTSRALSLLKSRKPIRDELIKRGVDKKWL